LYVLPRIIADPVSNRRPEKYWLPPVFNGGKKVYCLPLYNDGSKPYTLSTLILDCWAEIPEKLRNKKNEITVRKKKVIRLVIIINQIQVKFKTSFLRK
jgi:hypothetical protein